MFMTIRTKTLRDLCQKNNLWHTVNHLHSPMRYILTPLIDRAINSIHCWEKRVLDGKNSCPVNDFGIRISNFIAEKPVSTAVHFWYEVWISRVESLRLLLIIIYSQSIIVELYLSRIIIKGLIKGFVNELQCI